MVKLCGTKKLTNFRKIHPFPLSSVTLLTIQKCVNSITTLQNQMQRRGQRNHKYSTHRANVQWMGRMASVGQSLDISYTKMGSTTSRIFSKVVSATHLTEMTGVHRKKLVTPEVQKSGKQRSRQPLN